jgi:hypothetical protein
MSDLVINLVLLNLQLVNLSRTVWFYFRHLSFAVLAIADLFSFKVFLVSALLGAYAMQA